MGRFDLQFYSCRKKKRHQNNFIVRVTSEVLTAAMMKTIIWDVHAVQHGRSPLTFQWNVLLPSYRLNKPRKKPAQAGSK
jgi:hypothetical protein